MDLWKINNIGRLENILLTKKIMELEINKTYKITEMKPIKTKFGSQILARLDNEFTVFPPARIAKALEDDRHQFQQMVEASKGEDLHIRYISGKYNQCELIYAWINLYFFGHNILYR